MILSEALFMAKNRIKELRKAQNITLKGLVEMLKQKNIKVNASQISSYEKGTTPRNEEIWPVLAEILKTGVPYLMGLTDFRELPETEKTYTANEAMMLLESFATWQKVVTLPKTQARTFAEAEVRKFLLDVVKDSAIDTK